MEPNLHGLGRVVFVSNSGEIYVDTFKPKETEEAILKEGFEVVRELTLYSNAVYRYVIRPATGAPIPAAAHIKRNKRIHGIGTCAECLNEFMKVGQRVKYCSYKCSGRSTAKAYALKKKKEKLK